MKIGTIGTGFITSWFIETMNEVEKKSCIAICSRSEKNARELAKCFHIGKIYTDVRLMMEDDEIDTVYIASPNSLHFSHAKLALENRKNVILEKPFVSNASECKVLMQMAKEAHLFLFEAITTRYLPNVTYIKKQLYCLGNIHMVECNMSQKSRKYNELLQGNIPNVFNTKYSGGALMDINIYNIQLIYELFGSPKKVHYQANYYGDIDTSGVLIMQFEDFNAVCIGSKDSYAFNFIQIQGENGHLIVDSAACVVRKGKICINGKEEETFLFQDKQLTHYYYLKRLKQILEDKDYDACYLELEKTLRVMKVLDEARKSAGICFVSDKRGDMCET